MTIIWIPIILIWVLMIADGYKKGLLRILVSLGVTIVLILVLSPVIEMVILEETPVLQKLEEFFLNTASALMGTNGTEQAVLQGNSAGHFPLVEEIVDSFVENTSGSVFELMNIQNLIAYAARFLANFCVKMISFLIAFLLSNILLKVVFDFLNLVDKLPVIGWINHVGGAVLGVGKCVIYLWIAFAILMLFSQTEAGSFLIGEITGDKYLNFLYEHNLLVQYLVLLIGL